MNTQRADEFTGKRVLVTGGARESAGQLPIASNEEEQP